MIQFKLDDNRFLISLHHVGNGKLFPASKNTGQSCMRTYGYDNGTWFYVGGGSAAYQIQQLRESYHYMKDEKWAMEEIFKKQYHIMSVFDISADEVISQLKMSTREYKLDQIGIT